MSDKDISKGRELNEILGVSWYEIIFGGLLVFLLVSRAIFSILLADIAITRYTDSFFSEASGFIRRYTETAASANITTVLIWVIVGLLVYSLFWTFAVVYLDFRADIMLSKHFIHPKSLHQSSFWLASISRHVITATLYLVTIIYTFLLLKSIPIVYDTIKQSFIDGLTKAPNNILTISLILGGWLIGWHLLVVVRRLSIVLNKKIQ